MRRIIIPAALALAAVITAPTTSADDDPGRRPQPWRWVVTAPNGRTVATSGESYTNRADAVDAIGLLFADRAVIRQEKR